MPEYRYIAQRLTGDGLGELIDLDLPLSGVSITHNLSAPGELSAKISPEYSRMLGDDGQPIFKEGQTAIWAEADDEIQGGGILTKFAVSEEGSSWDLECVGVSGYTSGQTYVDEWYGVDVDPLDVVRHLWEHLQGKPRGNLGVVVDPTTSPVRIGTDSEDVEFETGAGEQVSFEAGPVKLAWYVTDDIGKKIDDLAEQTPFDFAEETSWATSSRQNLAHRIRLGYPTLGRRSEQRFVFGEEILNLPNIERDGEEWADQIVLLGAGEGRDQVRGGASRPSDGLRRVITVVDRSVTSVREANARAKRVLAQMQGHDEISELVLREDYGLQVGDEIRVNGEVGQISLDLWVRILSITIDPESSLGPVLSVRRTDVVG